jgi:hypothetical protein
MADFDLELAGFKVSVSSAALSITALSTIAKLTMGSGSRELRFEDLVAFTLEDRFLAIEGPKGVTNVYLKKGDKEAILPLVDAIKLRAPQALEGSVSKKLQGVEEGKERLADAKEALSEAFPTDASASKVDDRTNFFVGTFGKKISSFEGVDLFEKAIRFKGKAWSISGAQVSLEMGAPKSRMTLTRIGAGALLFGGAGAIVGGMSKKNKQRGFIEIITDEGGFVIEFDANQERKARQFLATLKNATR